MNEINQEQLEQFRKLGLIDEIALRNHFIKQDFKKLKDDGLKVDEAIKLLSEKYGRSQGLINLVVYSLNKN